MSEGNGKPARPLRETVSVTLLPELVLYVDECVASGVYRSRSHAIEEFIRKVKEDGSDAPQ